MCLSAPASAATIVVNDISNAGQQVDDGHCDLREAVTAANNDAVSGLMPGECSAGAGADTIVVPAGNEVFCDGELPITSAITVVGAGTAASTLSACDSSRAFHVHLGATLTLQDLTITSGKASDGVAGTGVGRGGPGADGGAIDNEGTLTLTRVAVTHSTAGSGGAGGSFAHPGGSGGDGGRGGAIYNAGTGTLFVENSSVNHDSAGTGGIGGFDGGNNEASGGRGGDGGGIYNAGELVLAASTVDADAAGAGGVGGNDETPSTPGGAGGSGGGIYNAAAASITASTLSTNSAGAGGAEPNGGANPPTNDGGRGGDGGGLASASAATTTMSNDTIAGDAAGDAGNGGIGQLSISGGNGGNGGNGGGVAGPSASSLVLTNVTISSDRVGSAPGSAGSATVVPNTAVAGQPGVGGGVSGPASLRNSIVALTAGGSCAGAISDLGGNVGFPDTTCPGLHADPKLGGLLDNGGPTSTEALGNASAALDLVPATGAGCPAADQRGVARPQGAACDAGAFEVQVAAPPPPGPPPAPPPAPGPPPAPPTLSSLSVRPAIFRAARNGASTAATTGARVSFTLSAAARVAFTVQRHTAGRQIGRSCATPSKRNRTKRRCTRTVLMQGSFSINGAAGGNGVHFSGRLNRRALRPGAYTLLAIATNTVARRSSTQRAGFHVRR